MWLGDGLNGGASLDKRGRQYIVAEFPRLYLCSLPDRSTPECPRWIVNARLPNTANAWLKWVQASYYANLYMYSLFAHVFAYLSQLLITPNKISQNTEDTLFFPVRIYNFHFTWIHKLFLVRTTSFCALLECTLLRYSNNRGALCMQRTINYSICCTNLFVLEQHYICCAHCAISSRHVICWVQT